MNILFTSVGRRVELLKAFRTAYRSLQLKGRIIAVDIDPLAPALSLVDRPYIVPRVESAHYIPALVDICAKEGVNAVFPLIDPDIHVLSQHRAQIEAVGARLAAVSVEAAKICGDKLLTAEFFQRLGLATPCTWVPGQVDPATAAYPLFIKPRTGSVAHNPLKDFVGARQLGMFSVRVRWANGEYASLSSPSARHAPDLTIESLSDSAAFLAEALEFCSTYRNRTIANPAFRNRRARSRSKTHRAGRNGDV